MKHLEPIYKLLEISLILHERQQRLIICHSCYIDDIVTSLPYAATRRHIFNYLITIYFPPVQSL